MTVAAGDTATVCRVSGKNLGLYILGNSGKPYKFLGLSTECMYIKTGLLAKAACTVCLAYI